MWRNINCARQVRIRTSNFIHMRYVRLGRTAKKPHFRWKTLWLIVNAPVLAVGVEFEEINFSHSANLSQNMWFEELIKKFWLGAQVRVHIFTDEFSVQCSSSEMLHRHWSVMNDTCSDSPLLTHTYTHTHTHTHTHTTLCPISKEWSADFRRPAEKHTRCFTSQ